MFVLHYVYIPLFSSFFFLCSKDRTSNGCTLFFDGGYPFRPIIQWFLFFRFSFGAHVRRSSQKEKSGAVDRNVIIIEYTLYYF